MRERDPKPLNTDELNARHRVAYDGVARRFAVVNAEMPEQVATSAASFLEATEGQGPLLDLGCGHGRDLAWFEARGLRVVGADLSAGMLSQAAQRVRCSLVQMDMRLPAFRTGIFRGVWCNAAILHLPKSGMPQTLGAIRRVLQPNGLFFVAIQIGVGESWESLAYGQPTARFFARYQPVEFAAYLERAGFEILSEDESCASPSRHWAHYLAKKDE